MNVNIVPTPLKDGEVNPDPLVCRTCLLPKEPLILEGGILFCERCLDNYQKIMAWMQGKPTFDELCAVAEPDFVAKGIQLSPPAMRTVELSKTSETE